MRGRAHNKSTAEKREICLQRAAPRCQPASRYFAATQVPRSCLSCFSCSDVHEHSTEQVRYASVLHGNNQDDQWRGDANTLLPCDDPTSMHFLETLAGLEDLLVYKHLPSGFSNRPLRSRLPLGSCKEELRSYKLKMPPEVTTIIKPDRAERLGWLTESSVQPRKRRAIEGARLPPVHQSFTKLQTSPRFLHSGKEPRSYSHFLAC